jgi:lipopolysaccharide/colanic/teichoic acid biosynthesis glycosyltransferase
MLVVAVATIIEDGLPVVFRQTRIGQNGQPFTIYKFRSMRLTDPEHGTGEAIGGSPQDKLQARLKFKTTTINDPRITAVGRVIRKTHLDELPQLFNVLLGEMSLVGVRPDTPAQEVDYDSDYWVKRHIHKPGITGLAQVMNDEKGGMAGRQHWETVWIEQKSLQLYYIVLFRTFLKVLKRNSF